MRHSKKGRKFGRKSGVRKALMRSLAVSLIKAGKIKTTEPKAKELKPYIEKMISSAKIGTIAIRKRLEAKIGYISSKALFDTYAPKFKERSGGYTRVIKLPARVRDASPMAIIEF